MTDEELDDIKEVLNPYLKLSDIYHLLNTMDRYRADKLISQNDNKEWPQNEVFMVDDVYEGIDELNNQSSYGFWKLSGGRYRCSKCNSKALLQFDKSVGGWKEYDQICSNFCPTCGAAMKGAK